MRRAAISLVELLVVLAIIALVAAVLLPAIQQAREAARRGDCASRLRQVGIALHTYVADHGVFPPGWVHAGGGIGAGPWNQNVLLLPHLGFKDLYNALNKGRFWKDPANRTVLSVSPGVFLCPTEHRATIDGHGVSNYLACNGSGRWPRGFDAICDPKAHAMPDGLFSAGTHRPGDCTDGLSHTAAFGEVIHGGVLNGITVEELRRGVHGVIYTLTVTPATQTELMRQCDNIGSVPTFQLLEPAGCPWALCLPYTHLFTPGKLSCWGGNMGDAFSPITASSRHIGCATLLLADGHVRFVSNYVDTEVWRALGSRSGSEPGEPY